MQRRVNLDIELQPSRQLLIWLLSLHGLAALIAAVYLPVLVAAFTILLLVGLLARLVQRHIRLQGRDVVIGLSFDGRQWQLRGHNWCDSADLRATTVWPFLVALEFRTHRHRRSDVLVMRDAVAAEAFTQLRVAARFAPVAE